MQRAWMVILVTSSLATAETATPPTRSQFERWGSRTCPVGTTLLYAGIAAGGRTTHAGNGFNALCLHPDPQHPQGFSDDNQNGALLYGIRYSNTGAVDKNKDKDAACALCQLNAPGDVYVQWGRSNSCSNTHTTLYSGFVMAYHHTQSKSEYVCVDPERAYHPQSSISENDGGQWYTTETEAGAMDENKYPPNREVGCSVCLAPKKVFVHWGSNSCATGSSTLYAGIAAGSRYNHGGSGANTLCLHTSPQHPEGFNDGDQNGALLYGVEYQNTGVLDGQANNQDAGCAVCQTDSPGDVYVQWGRSFSCSNEHTMLYTGLVMAEKRNHQRSEFVCVDPQRAHHAQSNIVDHDGQLWYTTEAEGGAMDENKYPPNREIGCSVCFAPKKMFVHWGSNSCANGSSTLYAGIVAGAQYESSGSGANTLCLHPDPQYPKGYSDTSQDGGSLYGLEYQNTGVLDGNYNKDAACAVCELDTAGDVYVQWGRSDSCSNGHTTLYKGLVMAEHFTHRRSEFVCVDPERSTHPQSSNTDHNGALWYTTETEYGSIDENKYPTNREIGCTVCVTPAISQTPTAVPSSAPPTTKPTTDPSRNSTSQPTASNPTTSPTTQPATNKPTSTPTVAPSVSPSATPSQTPTTSPSTSPKTRPTKLPTHHPTERPTEKPTSKPTDRPTQQPTRKPTSNPTVGPSHHTCDDGSHGCDKTKYGLCYPDISGPGYTCGCAKTHRCEPNCQARDHSCVWLTAPPMQQPTADPTIPPSQNPTSQLTKQPTTSTPSYHSTIQPITNNPSNLPSAPSTFSSLSPSVPSSTLPSRSTSTRPTNSPSPTPTASPSKHPTTNTSGEETDASKGHVIGEAGIISIAVIAIVCLTIVVVVLVRRNRPPASAFDRPNLETQRRPSPDVHENPMFETPQQQPAVLAELVSRMPQPPPVHFYPPNSSGLHDQHPSLQSLQPPATEHLYAVLNREERYGNDEYLNPDQLFYTDVNPNTNNDTF